MSEQVWNDRWLLLHTINNGIQLLKEEGNVIPDDTKITLITAAGMFRGDFAEVDSNDHAAIMMQVSDEKFNSDKQEKRASGDVITGKPASRIRLVNATLTAPSGVIHNLQAVEVFADDVIAYTFGQRKS